MKILESFKSGCSHFVSVVLMLLAFLLPQTVSAAEYCESRSAIDRVPLFVGQSFLDIFDRLPGGDGQAYWISRLENLNASGCKSADPDFSAGACEWNNAAQITLELLTSPESTSRHGNLNSNNEFVTTLHQLFLRHTPEEEGLRSHLATLASGGTRARIVADILSSAEYRHRFACMAQGNSNPSCRGAEAVDPIAAFVTQVGRDFPGSVPDTSSQESWTRDITSKQAGMCRNSSGTAFSACDYVIEAQMIMDLLNSSAYQKSHPAIADNKAFVSALYEHLLQRAPDARGLQFHTSYVDETKDRVGAIFSIITSDEYRQHSACYAGKRDQINLGFTGHPFTQAAYSDAGISYNQQTELVKNAGALWYRVDVVAPPTGADFTRMDALVRAAQANGVQLLPILIPMVDRVHDNLQTIYSKAHDMAFNFVNRYKTSIHVWELSNEQDVYSIHKAGDPGWAQATFSNGERITDYDSQRFAIAAAVLRGLADGVRAADAGALRVVNFGGWLHTGFLELLEKDQTPFDIMGLHWYQGMGEMTCIAEAFPCPARPKFFNVIQRVQTLTHDKPIWVTETNYTPVSTRSPEANKVAEDEYLASSLERYARSPNVYPFPVIMIYELLDEPNLQADVTQKQVGFFPVTPTAHGQFLLDTTKSEGRSLLRLTSR